MKKSIWIVLLGLIILPLFLNLLSSAENISGLGSLNPENLEDTTVKLTSSWEYLSQEWKTILLRNSFVKGVDSFCLSISTVFFVLFSESYSFSLELLLVIFVWVYFLLVFNNIFSNFSTFSKWASFGISFALTLMFAHLKIIKMPVTAIIWFFFGEKPWWAKIMIGAIVVALLVLVFILIKKFGKDYKAKRQKVKDALNSLKLEGQVKAGEKISEVLSKIK